MIAQATKNDLQGVLEVEQRAFVKGIRAETIVPFEDQLNSFPKGFLVMRENNNVVVGYITGQLIRKEDNLYIPDKLNKIVDKPDYLYITSIATDYRSGAQRGFQLANALIERFPELPFLGVVNLKWTKAVKMWMRLGFKCDGILADFFHPTNELDEPGLVFIRNNKVLNSSKITVIN